jgi:hypothetical protein
MSSFTMEIVRALGYTAGFSVERFLRGGHGSCTGSPEGRNRSVAARRRSRAVVHGFHDGRRRLRRTGESASISVRETVVSGGLIEYITCY